MRTNLRILTSLLSDTAGGIRVRNLLDEDIQQQLKPPVWVKGYEALWWAAVARLYAENKHMKNQKADYGAVTQIFKAYLKRLTGYNIDSLKKLGVEDKPGEMVAGAKSEIAKGMQGDSSSASKQFSMLGAINNSLSSLLNIKDDQEFIKAVKEKIYMKYLKKAS